VWASERSIGPHRQLGSSSSLKERIMPTEFRFDDLDLREEPASGKSPDADASLNCTDTKNCTVTCHTSRNTCTTYLC
jgi:hypothetical protein